MSVREDDGDDGDRYLALVNVSLTEENLYPNELANRHSTKGSTTLRMIGWRDLRNGKRTLKYPSMNRSEGYLPGSMKNDGIKQIYRSPRVNDDTTPKATSTYRGGLLQYPFGVGPPIFKRMIPEFTLLPRESRDHEFTVPVVLVLVV